MLGNIVSKVISGAPRSPAAKELVVAAGSRLSSLAALSESHSVPEIMKGSFFPRSSGIEQSLKQPLTEREILLNEVRAVKTQISETKSNIETIKASLDPYMRTAHFLNGGSSAD